MGNRDSLRAEHFAELPVFALTVTAAASDLSLNIGGLGFFLVAFVVTDMGLRIRSLRVEFRLGSGTINLELLGLF